MSNIDKQWLQQKIADMEAARDEIPFSLDEDDSNTLAALRIALASLEAEPVISHLGSKNALDAIVAFIKSNKNPTLKDYNEVSERLFQDNCHGLSNHVIEYIKQIGEELEELRSTQDTAPPAPVSDSLLSELLGIAKRAAYEADECAHAEFSDDSMEHSAAIADWERRAAMLQGAEHVTTANKLPFEQWLSQQTGAIDVECGCVMTEVFFHWLRVAYEAANSSVIPDGVCPCCGRKPLKNRTCSVSGCDGKHVARGFCIKHYAIERKKDPSRRESIRAADKRYRARKAAAPQQEVK